MTDNESRDELNPQQVTQQPITLLYILSVWWPLAGSWLLMGFELPMVSAVMARLPNPETSLAAYGGVVFPVALIVEAPIIMLLSASTALAKDWHAYRLMRRYMTAAGAVLTAVHMLIAFTPLFDFVVVGLMGAPEPIREPARLGLMIMTPWTWSIAYRRFQQGVLIRHGLSRYVIAGTGVRLGAAVAVLVVGFLTHRFSGIVVGTAAVSLGVLAEAIAVGLWAHPVVRDRLRSAPAEESPLTSRQFIAFYIPLALTPLVTLAAQPVVSACIARMPLAISSLAVIPAIHGLTFLLRSIGFSFNEVVVSLLDRPDAYRPLRKFAFILTAVNSVIILALAATPLGFLYFARLVGLPDPLVDLGRTSLWLVLTLPGMAVLQHFFQGILVHARRTVPVSEAVALNFATIVVVLAVGVAHGGIAGIYVGMAAYALGNLFGPAWLAWRGRGERQRLLSRS